jgi:endonuclease/exonuclease/phosphatase (EEP) superfamily protein YafD
MTLALYLFVALLFLASLLPVWRREAWWVRVFDFPRVQIMVLGLVAAALLITVADLSTWRGLLALGATLAAVALQGARIFPYTPLARVEVRDARQCPEATCLALLVANVRMENRQAEQLLALLRRNPADVLLLLEPDAWWERHMQPMEAEYGYALKRPLDNRYGMLMYSRLPLRQAEVHFLIREGIPSFHAQVQLRGGTWVWLHAVHPEPPSPTEADTSLPRDVELLVVGRAVAQRGEPAVVAGDLNDVAWSYTTTLFQKMSGLLDPRKGRGMFNTFHARIPFLRWPLDHVFHSREFLLCEMRRLPAFGSDHFPVFVRLAYQPDAAARQQAPDARAEDRETAHAKMAKAGKKR